MQLRNEITGEIWKIPTVWYLNSKGDNKFNDVFISKRIAIYEMKKIIENTKQDCMITPSSINYEAYLEIKEKYENKYHFFWKSKLSNWEKSNFTVQYYFNPVTYNCGEQMMMHLKALHFKDYIIAEQIIKCDNPKEIKALGRRVQNFKSEEWDRVKYDLVKIGLYNRFTQNLVAKEELLKHKGKLFVEASPYDRIWGIGYTKEEAIDNIDNWGENLLGKILTELSNEIK